MLRNFFDIGGFTKNNKVPEEIYKKMTEDVLKNRLFLEVFAL